MRADVHDHRLLGRRADRLGGDRANDKDRLSYDRLDDVEAARLLLLHIRHDSDRFTGTAYLLFVIWSCTRRHRESTRLAPRLIPPAPLRDPRPIAQRDLVLRPTFHRRAVGRSATR